MKSFNVNWGNSAGLAFYMLISIKHFLLKLVLVFVLLIAVYIFAVPKVNPEKDVNEQDISLSQQDISKYYGGYEYGAANIYLDEGIDDNSFYVYVSFEPSASWWVPMHGNVPLDGEPHFLFYADSPSSAQNVVAEKDLISGAISLEPIDNGSLHMVLYKDTNDDDPYNVELVPST